MPWTLPRLRASRDKHRQRAQHAARDAKRSRRIGIRQRAIVRKRTRQIQKLSGPRGAAAAVKWALSQAGTAESPWGSNWGPRISDWIKASGYTGPVPWCQCFANAVAVHGGAPQLRTGYTPAVLDGEGGYKPISAAQARAGDMVFFKFPGVSSATCDHVGILTDPPSGGVVHTVEGNTSSGLAGSQNNGGGVYARTRSISLVAGYIRPPYPKG